MISLDAANAIISEEVREALAKNKAVVALESTIISHGMPYPQNVETALEVESVVRANRAIPATIAILNGVIKIGLSSTDIETLGKSEGVRKVSRRDLAEVVYKKQNGATTVAATMILAEAAGIQIFATGGIGGVHRNFGQTLDISADLLELSQRNVAVVCAGIKSILDLPATLEQLETLGVPVIGYRSKELAAFYTRNSGIELQSFYDKPEDVGEYLKCKWNMNLRGGVLISNPVPAEFSMDRSEIESVIENALEEAEKKNITGKDITPFLLNNVKKMTSGRSLEANIALIKNNAEIAAQIALAMAR